MNVLVRNFLKELFFYVHKIVGEECSLFFLDILTHRVFIDFFTTLIIFSLEKKIINCKK